MLSGITQILAGRMALVELLPFTLHECYSEKDLTEAGMPPPGSGSGGVQWDLVRKVKATPCYVPDHHENYGF